jgi:uncharacterized protein (TIGR02145 family)
MRLFSFELHKIVLFGLASLFTIFSACTQLVEEDDKSGPGGISGVVITGNNHPAKILNNSQVIVRLFSTNNPQTSQDSLFTSNGQSFLFDELRAGSYHVTADVEGNEGGGQYDIEVPPGTIVNITIQINIYITQHFHFHGAQDGTQVLHDGELIDVIDGQLALDLPENQEGVWIYVRSNDNSAWEPFEIVNSGDGYEVQPLNNRVDDSLYFEAIDELGGVHSSEVAISSSDNSLSSVGSYSLQSLSSQSTISSTDAMISSLALEHIALNHPYCSQSAGNCDQFTDGRDGMQYTWTKIGLQKWMAQNLNFDPAGETTWCYDGLSENCDENGRLYTWYTVMDGSSSSNNSPSGVQGICPSGWHLPSELEWDELMAYLLSEYPSDAGLDGDDYLYLGKYLKSETGWDDFNAIAGLDTYGLNLKPSGRRYTGGFEGFGIHGHFWTSTESNASEAHYWFFEYDDDAARRYDYDKGFAYAVRCVAN